MLRPVTAGIDGSPQSLAAACWAAHEAQLRNAPLRILHAWKWSPHPPHCRTCRHGPAPVGRAPPARGRGPYPRAVSRPEYR
ncbi:universal stress protein [Streptomyces sp. A5-4]|uniref:universal stress protein n=1 Tax=Streptomyces sp. A5-4 TaxID=3384771 RepID=UPI003DA7C4A3